MEEQYLLQKIRLLPNELKQEIMDFIAARDNLIYI